MVPHVEELEGVAASSNGKTLKLRQIGNITWAIALKLWLEDGKRVKMYIGTLRIRMEGTLRLLDSMNCNSSSSARRN
jgi:hypothetical protein